MTWVEWNATAKTYSKWDGEGDEYGLMKLGGDFEVEQSEAIFYRSNHSQLEKRAELEAIKAAARLGLDQETVEMTDLIFVDEEKKGLFGRLR